MKIQKYCWTLLLFFSFWVLFETVALSQSVKRGVSQQKLLESEQRRQARQKQRFEAKIRLLCVILTNEEVRKLLDITAEQEEQFAELSKTYLSQRESIINPKGKKLSTQSRQKLIRHYRDKLQTFDLRTGTRIAGILTPEQITAFGSKPEFQRAKRQWELQSTANLASSQSVRNPAANLP